MVIAPPFRGDRAYIHVADIVAALVDGEAGVAAARLTLRSLPDRPLRVRPAAEPAAAGEAMCGTFSLTGAAGGIRHLHLLRCLDDAVVGRVPFDEESLLQGCTADRDGIDMPRGGPGTFVERLVAGAVETLLQRMPEDFWRVAELRLDHLPPNGAAIRFRIVSAVGGRFWKGTFTADGRPTGDMILALVQKIPSPDVTV